MTTEQKEFADLLQKNLSFKHKRLSDSAWDAESEIKTELQNTKYRAVTVLFSDIEGRLHMLDYDKSFLLKNSENLTFDGSSIRGFTAQCESDLRLRLDWAATYFLPVEFFGEGKVYIFAEIMEKDGTESYSSDIRAMLAKLLIKLREPAPASGKGMLVNVAAEIEGFLFHGTGAEKRYGGCGFNLVTESGYFNTLPQDPFRNYIDTVARVQRAVGFENEKDHPEVAPSQFEVNWAYTDALIAADQIQLYKMICRQVANHSGWTASFLPKPIVGINGSGMHTNISLMRKDDRINLFFGKKEHNISERAMTFIEGILAHAEDLCLILNPSVNSYRRLDPAMEAPNEIKSSANDRGSMIRIPIGNERSSRIEVRTVSPDTNPYLVIYCLLKAGLSGEKTDRHVGAVLPPDIYSSISLFGESQFMREILGLEVRSKYLRWKQESADRCPRKLGKSIKPAEIMYHHEVTNQMIWENVFAIA